MGNYFNKVNSEKKDDGKCDGKGKIPEEYTLPVYFVRKDLLLKELNLYFYSNDQNSVYHKHVVNSKEIITVDGITRIYCLRSSLFYTLWKVDMTEHHINDKIIQFGWIN